MARTDVAPAARPAPTGRQPQRRIGKRISLVLGALLIIAAALPLLVQFRIPLDALRGEIVRHARAASGLDVRIEGPLYLLTGPRAGVELHDLVVTGEQAQQPVEIVRLGVVRAEIELRALLARELRLGRVRAENFILHLDPAAMAALARAERREAARGTKAASPGWHFVDVTRVDINHARLVTSTPGVPRLPDVVVDHMTLHAVATEPLAIDAHGSFVGEAMQLQLRAASLAQMRGGAQSSPINLELTLADASLQVNGAFDVDSGQGEYRLSAKGHGRFLERALPGFQAALGDGKDVSVEGLLRTTSDAMTLESMMLVAGRTRGQGEIHYGVANGRMRVQSRLVFQQLDLRPWLPLIAERGRTGSAKGSVLDEIRTVQKSADLDFDLSAAQLIWPQREAQNVEAGLRLDQKAVVLAASGQLLAGTVKLDAQLDTTAAEAQLRLDAQAGSIALEALHPAVVNAGISGLIEAAKLDASGRGESMTALAASLEGTLELSKVDASWAPERDAAATRIKIDRATLVATRDALQGSFAAAIDDARIALELSGTRAQLARAQRSVQSEFDLSMTRGSRRGARFAARGTLGFDPQSWTLEANQAALGATRGSLAAKGAWKAGAPLSIRASFERFDVAALDFFDFESVQRRTRPVSGEQRVVLPSGLRLAAADFELSAGTLDAAPLQLTDLRIAGRARDGRLETTRVELRTAGGALRGELSADLRGKIPRLQGRLDGADFDARSVLERLGVRLERASAKRIEAKFELRGARLKEIVAQSTLELSARDVDAALPGPLAAHRKLVFKGRFDASSAKGQLRGATEGSLNGTAFRATSRGPQLATLLARADRVPLDIELRAADSTLALQGSVARGPTADLRVELNAKHADALLALAGLTTQARGALTASGRLELTPPARYAFTSLDVKLGESRLAGHVVADWSGARPSIEAKLAGPALHLRDLGVQASDVEGKLVGAEKGDGGASAAPAWLSSLREVDGSLDLQVERSFAAGEPLGSLSAKARLTAGRLHFGPLRLQQGDSVLRTEGEVDAAASPPTYVVEANLRAYDITPLLRYFELSEQGTATFDARAALRSHGLGAEVISNLSGVFDVASYGSGVGSGSIEQLGVNLLGLVFNVLDRSRQSKINCVVGVFDVDQGVMKSRALFIDTTLLRIIGNLDVDLAAETLNGGLRPNPKNPRLFNVSTPLRISGTFEHPEVSAATSALPELLIRYSNPYTIFLGALMETENAAPDGSADCRAAYAKADAARPELGDRAPGFFRFLQ